MSQDHPWWFNSDQSQQEKPVALDDVQPEPAWLQALHDRFTKLEEMIRAHMPSAPACETEAAPPEQSPSVEGVA